MVWGSIRDREQGSWNSCWDPQDKARAPEWAGLPLFSYVIHCVVNSYHTKSTLLSKKWVLPKGGVQSSLGIARGYWAQLLAKGISELVSGGCVEVGWAKWVVLHTQGVGWVGAGCRRSIVLCQKLRQTSLCRVVSELYPHLLESRANGRLWGQWLIPGRES